VFVTTGALRSMKSESQLAGVLGHEVAHVAKHHGIDAIKKQMIAGGIATAAVKDQGYLIEMASDMGMKLLLKGFDRAAESEADEYGQKYAASAGYDPKGIEEFLTTLSQQGEAPIWLMPVSSHPRSDDRVAALAAKRPAAPEGAIVGKEAFQKQVLSVLGAAGTKK
jgi:predicted Zn-dependent protease